MEIELNEKMYYACSQCSIGSKIQWHRPGTQRWYDHKDFINLDETNTDRPKYFWCTLHRKPHDLQRSCLKYKAVITYDGNKGKVNSRTSQLSHDDTLFQIDKYVSNNSNAMNWKRTVHCSNSLPWPCNRDTRLRVPDIIYCEPDRTLKFKHSITNIIEFETETQVSIILEKSKDYDLSSKIMIQKNAQNRMNLPRVIFLYGKQTTIPVNEIKQAIQNMTFEYLDDVIVDYYDQNGAWFMKYFKKSKSFRPSSKNGFDNRENILEICPDGDVSKNKRKFPCLICGKQLKTEEGIAQHLKDTICGKKEKPLELLNSSSKVYICSACQKKFLNTNSLNQHIRDRSKLDENHNRLYSFSESVKRPQLLEVSS